MVVLQLPELRERRVRPWSARLFYAYADALLDAGRTEQAREWFARAAAADRDEQTDAAERFDDLDDVVIDDLAEDDDDLAEDDDLADRTTASRDRRRSRPARMAVSPETTMPCPRATTRPWRTAWPRRTMISAEPGPLSASREAPALALLAIRGSQRRATRVQPGAALRYQ